MYAFLRAPHLITTRINAIRCKCPEKKFGYVFEYFVLCHECVPLRYVISTCELLLQVVIFMCGADAARITICNLQIDFYV